MRSLFSLVSVATWLVLAAGGHAAGLYSKSSPVVQVDASNYERLIASSNHTSVNRIDRQQYNVVDKSHRFYAPWCGHCRSLQPAFEKAAKALAGLAKVAAVNCDEDGNKAFCGSLGVQGFPTLKIVKPSKKQGRPLVEDYQGARTANAIIEAVVDKMPNHVKRVTDKSLDGWLKESNSTAKAVLFSNRVTTGSLIKALAVDFLGGISFAQVRHTDEEVVDFFGVTSFPSLVLLPGGVSEGLVYQGDYKKETIIDFLKQVADPNPDPAPITEGKKASKASKATADGAKSSRSSSALSMASASQRSAESAEAKASATAFTVDEADKPVQSPDPNVVTEESASTADLSKEVPTLTILETEPALLQACFGLKSHICILALLPASSGTQEGLPSSAVTAISSLSDIAQKYVQRKVKIFPFYSVPAENPLAAQLRQSLDLKGSEDFALVAVNSKKQWWKVPSGEDYSFEALDGWIDALRMGEGKKNKLPSDVAELRESTGKATVQEDKPIPEKATEGSKVAQATDNPVHEEL